jgi:hypothetical protein
MKKLILILALALASCHCKTVTISGTVVSHNVTSDEYGKATYRTVITCEDGYIRERCGLSFYVVPIGQKCHLEETICN